MAEHDDQRHPEHGDGVLEAADHGIGDDLAGVAHDEQIAEALVEDDLGSQAGVRASEECGARRLAAGQSRALLDVLSGMFRLTGDEAGVAALHLLPHLARGRDV